jgi:hypothetical protein
MPGRTPSRATPRNAAIDSPHSVRRCRHRRTTPETSASERDATITTAASVGCGRSRSRPGKASSIVAIATAPTRPVTCVFAPACSATAVREPLVLTGKPWNSPAAMFAAPTPSISRFPSISLPLRPANADAVAIVSANETSAMPNAPPTRSGMSDAWTSGIESGGNPCGSGPTRSTPRPSSPNA